MVRCSYEYKKYYYEILDPQFANDPFGSNGIGLDIVLTLRKEQTLMLN